MLEWNREYCSDHVKTVQHQNVFAWTPIEIKIQKYKK